MKDLGILFKNFLNALSAGGQQIINFPDLAVGNQLAHACIPEAAEQIERVIAACEQQIQLRRQVRHLHIDKLYFRMGFFPQNNIQRFLNTLAVGRRLAVEGRFVDADNRIVAIDL